MKFNTPNKDSPFDILDDWWLCAEMDNFSPHECGFYLYPWQLARRVEVVPIVEVQPPTRNDGVPLLVKRNLLPILFGFTDPNCALPPVKVTELPQPHRYRFRLRDGCHRYYASVAAGYTKLPVIVETGSQPNSR